MEFVIGLLAVFLILFSAGYLFRRNIYKEIDRLEAWKIEILNRSIVEEMSKIKHLKMTGQTEEFFERWRKEWDEIVTSHMPKVEELLFEAEDCADKYRFQKSKQVLAHIENLLSAAESNIEDILKEIADLVSSEEQNRKEIEEIKEQYTKIRKNLLAYSHLYGDLYPKIEADLDTVWEGIKQFEAETEGGNYIEARKVLLAQDRLLEELQSHIDDVPKLLAGCKQTVPNELAKLKAGHQEMIEKGYKLDHIQIEKELENLFKELKRAEDALLTEINLEEAAATMQMIEETIQTLYSQLEDEVEAGQLILGKVPELAAALEKLETHKQDTKAETDLVKESYRLTNDELEKQQSYEKRLEMVEKQFVQVKERLDQKHVAYSLLKEELSDIEKQLEAAQKEHDEYRDMLQMLRKEELQARELLQQLKQTITNTARRLEKSNVPGIPASVTEKIQQSRSAVQKVNEQFQMLPLNMDVVNERLEEAEQLVTEVKEQTDELVEKVLLIERIIQYGNRFRSQNHMLSEQLKEAENRFYSYEYDEAYDIAARAVEKASPGSVERLGAQTQQPE
ncbi:septation ring formation regulator EzrA [Bacillus swezeyi]|uniref:Septation ring formation regulator EzrA n=1 Tax=Bacillus swezeyi TaxID=1925020 RepID=A0A5M8RJ29_9BACI|nr:septation ring formation regulator EzrA [Bacillus swezeyi]KAA6448595.1 septation ring formation regulator EzrA [Bacillus swezeyi]TYS34907.1 septation ring formation regulator EzrA [Bacillus swezeyi]